MNPPAVARSGPSMQLASVCGSNSVIDTTYAIIATHEEQCFINAVNYSNGLTGGTPAYQIYVTGALTFNNSTLILPLMTRGLAIYSNNAVFTVPADHPLVFGSASTGSPYVLRNMIITNGGNVGTTTYLYGGAIRNYYSLNIYDSVFTNNASENDGGAIYTTDTLTGPAAGAQGSVYLERVHFINNSAGGGSAIQVEFSAALAGDCVAFENNNGNYGQSVLIGSNGGTVSLRRSGFRTKYVPSVNSGTYAQLYNLTNNSFTVNDSYFKPSSSGSGMSVAAVIVDPGYRLEVSAHVSVYNPQSSDPTLNSECAFHPPASPPQQQVPQGICEGVTKGVLVIHASPSSVSATLDQVNASQSLLLTILGVYKPTGSTLSSWWYLIKYHNGILGWVSGQFQLSLPPCPEVALVDQNGNLISVTPTPSPTITPSVTAGPSPTPNGNPLLAYGIQTSVTNGAPAWTPTELQAMLNGVTAVAQALRSISKRPAAVSQQLIFMDVMGITPTTQLQIIRSGNGSTYPNGYCFTDSNFLTITCYGATLIDPNGAPLTFTEYVLVHELGHQFDSRAGVNGQQRLVEFMKYGQPIQDCDRNRVLGEAGGAWSRGERGWGTGPARIGLSVRRQVTTFQQNANLIEFQAATATPPTIEHEFLVSKGYAIPILGVTDPLDAKQIRVDEAAADMFLNWVYRRNSQGAWPYYANIQFCSLSTPSSIPSFLNLSWFGGAAVGGLQTPIPDTVARSGDARFAWMDYTMDVIVSAQGW